jgi:mRNA-degrading endonuclease RelE of RelBE toxin-antitoxin system
MKSHTTRRFREAFKHLPKPTQRRAREAYNLFQQNPYHPSLRFKQVHPTKPIYSVRISRDYRAVGVRDGDEMVWFWIGSHTDYEQLLSNL